MCLHHLSDILCELGVDAYIATESTFHGNKAKIILWDFKTPRSAPLGPEVPVIYPEVVFGNPLNSNHCIRWLLNAPGVLGGPKEFPSGDLLYIYGDRCRPTRRLVNGYLRHFEPHLDKFKDEGLNRKGWLHLIHKGRPYRYHVPWSRNIDQDKYQGLEHMAQIFKTAKFLVCYDLNTFTTVHAALSGCITIVAPQKGISRSEQLNGSWYQKYGVAYGYTDIPRALRTLPLLREEIESHKTKSILTIKSFIKDIKKLTD